jgi:multidrug efflux system membrane fusion protein
MSSDLQQPVSPATSPALDPYHASSTAGPSKGSALRKIIVVVVILAAVGAVVWKIRSNAKEQAAVATTGARDTANRAIPVLVAAVQQKKMPIYLTALGTVTPYYSVTVKTRVDGQLLSVPVREGQSVRKGQVLAEIDPAPYKAALAQAEGQLAKDTATADYAKVEAQRYKDLYDAGVVSKDSAQTQASTAGQSVGTLQADQAAIQAAKVNVAYTQIVSPIDGVVGLRQVDPGNIVHASDSTGLILVTQLQPISVIFTLPEDQLPEVLKLVRQGKKLQVEAYDRSDSTHLASGTLLTLDNSIDPTTGTDKVKAVFPNKDGALFPNQFVNVRLVLQERPDAIVVPAAAIQTGSQGTFVFVVKQGTPPGGAGGRGAGGRRGGAGAAAPAADGSAPVAATPTAATPGATPAAGGGGGRRGGGNGAQANGYVVQQPVTIDVTEGTQVILSSGVNPGDKVVIDGEEKLLPNSRVIAQDASPTDGRGAGNGAGGANKGAQSGAFGPGSAGPSEPAADSHKQGLETGRGVHPGTTGGAPATRGPASGGPADGQPRQHRHGPPQTQTGQVQ